MTKLLEDAFALARQLPDDQQDRLARRIIDDLTEDDAGLTTEETCQVAAVTEALAEYRQGRIVLRPHDEVLERLEAKIRASTNTACTES